MNNAEKIAFNKGVEWLRAELVGMFLDGDGSGDGGGGCPTCGYGSKTYLTDEDVNKKANESLKKMKEETNEGA